MTLIDPGGPRHESVADGFVTVSVPSAWETVRGAYPGVELVVVEPEQRGLFRANLVLAVADVAMGFADWQKGTDMYLAKELRDYVLLDLEKLPVGGHPGGRRLATYATSENQSVTMEQWTTLVDGRGVTLTASTGTLTYAHHSFLIADVVASLHVGARRGDRSTSSEVRA